MRSRFGKTISLRRTIGESKGFSLSGSRLVRGKWKSQSAQKADGGDGWPGMATITLRWGSPNGNASALTLDWSISLNRPGCYIWQPRDENGQGGQLAELETQPALSLSVGALVRGRGNQAQCLTAGVTWTYHVGVGTFERPRQSHGSRCDRLLSNKIVTRSFFRCLRRLCLGFRVLKTVTIHFLLFFFLSPLRKCLGFLFGLWYWQWE